MGDRDQFNKAFQDERHGFGAGIPTSLGGTLGQMSARQQKDLAEGRVQNGAMGHLLIEMVRGGWISRGILVLILGFVMAIGGANAVPGTWWVAAGISGGMFMMLAGVVMILIGILRRIVRWFR